MSDVAEIVGSQLFGADQATLDLVNLSARPEYAWFLRENESLLDEIAMRVKTIKRNLSIYAVEAAE